MAKVYGARELEQGLADIFAAIRDRIGPDAEESQAEHLKDALVDAAPYDAEAGSPHLRDEVGVVKVSGRALLRTEYRIDFGSAFWWRFREFGTVNEPARPWAQSTIDAEIPQLKAIQIRALNKGIAEEGRKQRRRYGRILPNGRNG